MLGPPLPIESLPLGTIDYGYDTLSRLASVNAPTGLTTYDYDPVGNRLTMTRVTGTSYSYDRADRIQSAGATAYTVDANGNLTARGTDSFAYDQGNRLKSATVTGVTTSYVFDGDGKRASMPSGVTTTSYLYDVSATLPVLLEDGSRKYVWGQGLAYAVDSLGSVEVQHADGLGSVRALTDGNAQVVQTYQSDEFGVQTQSQGTRNQPFEYTGEQRDAETGFVYLRARVYDPQMGRFLQRDWIAKSGPGISGWNRYAYAANDPANLTDPSGFAAGNPADGISLGEGVVWEDSGAPDSECAKRGAGPGVVGLGGYIINAGCLETPLGTIVLDPVETPWGTMHLPRVVPMAGPPDDGSGNTDGGGLAGSIYKGKRDHPSWLPDFVRAAPGAIKKVVIQDRELLQKLQEAVPGRWRKVYEDGYSGGRRVSLHYFQHESGQTFGVKAVWDHWSTQ
ncbi:MAG: RHS repeat-associated core domain-containing protein [Chloroflexi bacterium]|nr:RHS repeat-associated core domain-containing protein [Chloroflexota bacterium]